MLLPWSAFIWRYVPGFGAVIQFPWRFCAVLTVAAAGLFAGAIDDAFRSGAVTGKRPSLTALLSLAVVVIFAGNLTWRVDQRFRHPDVPRIDLTRNVDPMYNTYVPARDLDAFAKSVGTTPDTWDVAPAPVVEGLRAQLTGAGTIHLTPMGPRKILVSIQSEGDARALIGQLNFPLWKIVPAGQSAHDETLSTSDQGLIEVSVGPGRHDFWLVFDGGWPERLGDIVTVASIALIAAAFVLAALFTKQSQRHADQQLVSS
jgi:hypothetical protein